MTLLFVRLVRPLLLAHWARLTQDNERFGGLQLLRAHATRSIGHIAISGIGGTVVAAVIVLKAGSSEIHGGYNSRFVSFVIRFRTPCGNKQWEFRIT